MRMVNESNNRSIWNYEFAFFRILLRFHMELFCGNIIEREIGIGICLRTVFIRKSLLVDKYAEHVFL